METTKLNAVMFRLLGRNHAVCWLESGAVLEVRVLVNDSPVQEEEANTATTTTSALTHQKTMAELMQNPPHMLGPVPVWLFPPFEWDAASGVLRVHAIEKQQPVC